MMGSGKDTLFNQLDRIHSSWFNGQTVIGYCCGSIRLASGLVIMISISNAILIFKPPKVIPFFKTIAHAKKSLNVEKDG
jgi:hypothetical protein